MKLVSWNVNGLRACLGKGFLASMTALNPDVICLQETKMMQGQAELDLADYTEYWNSAEKKGYSGTAVFSKTPPLSIRYGMDYPEHDREGRVITLEFDAFYLVNVYTPNAQRELARIDYRMAWEDAFRDYVCGLDKHKPVVICGDLNVAHEEIDLKNPKSNRGNAGFSEQERGRFSTLLEAGFTDTFRALHPELEGAYTWWSYRFDARVKNVGWRIDYFLVSHRLFPQVEASRIYPEITGSDHCPVELEL